MLKRFFVFIILILALVAGYFLGVDHRVGGNLTFTDFITGVFSTAPTHHATSMNREFFDNFYAAVTSTIPIKDDVISGVVPHHLVAGKYLATFFEKLKNKSPPVVVLIGPNHPNAGRNNIITGLENWRTPYGELKVNQNIVNRLTSDLSIQANEPIIGDEHTIGAVVPFIKHSWPHTTLVPLIVKSNAGAVELDALAQELTNILPSGSIVLASVDFSHYLPEPVASFHDELALNVLATADQNQLARLEIDNRPSLQFLLDYNKLTQAENFHLVAHTNSATISNLPDLAQTTSHILGYYTTGPPSQTPAITTQFFGDIMLDRNVAKAMGTEGLDYVFKNLRGQEDRFFSGVDAFVANLEGPFAPARVPTSKTIAFRFDPKFAPALKKFGFTAFSLANNHSYDMGASNVAFTRATLAAAGLGYFGDELNEGSEYTWFTSTTPTVAFIGIHNTYHEPDKTKLLAAITAAKAQTPYIVAFTHWGIEYQTHSSPKQQALAHWLIDNGVSAVIGAHPHVVEEMEIYKNTPIFYSLGNFVFDQYFSTETQEGLSVGLTFEGGGVKSIYLFPLYSVKSQPALMIGASRDNFLDWMSKNSRLDGRSIIDGMINL